MDNLTIKISKNLKTLRGERGWNLDTASQKTGVSKAMLGQIERRESSPTISTLWKIVSGFNVSFSSFVEGTEKDQEKFIHRKQELQHIHKNDNKIKVMPIFPFDEQLGFEAFIIELLPGCTHLSLPHQKGVIEHIIPISGTVDILVEKTWHKLKKNEGFRFSAELPHGYRNLSDSPSLLHNIIHYT